MRIIGSLSILTFRLRINLLPYSCPRSIFGTVNTLLRKTGVSLGISCMAPSSRSSLMDVSTTGSTSFLSRSSLVGRRVGGADLRGSFTPWMAWIVTGSCVISCQSLRWPVRPAALNCPCAGTVTVSFVTGLHFEFTKFKSKLERGLGEGFTSSPFRSFPESHLCLWSLQHHG